MRSGCNIRQLPRCGSGKDGFMLSPLFRSTIATVTIFSLDSTGFLVAYHPRLFPKRALPDSKVRRLGAYTGGKRLKHGLAYAKDALLRWHQGRAPNDLGDSPSGQSEVFPETAVWMGKGATQQVTVPRPLFRGTIATSHVRCRVLIQ